MTLYRQSCSRTWELLCACFGSLISCHPTTASRSIVEEGSEEGSCTDMVPSCFSYHDLTIPSCISCLAATQVTASRPERHRREEYETCSWEIVPAGVPYLPTWRRHR